MSAKPQKWSSNLMFLIAAVGAEAGVASVWKFSYLAGTNGGGVFVIAYAFALILIGLPALLAEMIIGKRGGGSMVGSLGNLAGAGEIGPYWKGVGYLAFICIVLTISYYFVICGWMLNYFRLAVLGRFAGIDAKGAEGLVESMLSSPGLMLINSALLIATSVITISSGLRKGIERVSAILTPMRFGVLTLLVILACLWGDFSAAARFLFSFDPNTFQTESLIAAVGQAFFSLGVGLGVMMTVAAYMKIEYSLATAVIVIGVAQLLVALMAGLAIFPFVFSAGISPAEGPALLFVAIPVALASIPMGWLIGILLFLLMTFAAITATSVMVEAIVAVVQERSSLSKPTIAALVGFIIWALGILTVLSFSHWSAVHPLAAIGVFKNPFELLEYSTSNILMPLAGLLVCLLAGWGLPAAIVSEELGRRESNWQIRTFRTLSRWIIPAVIVLLFVGMV